MSEVILKSYDHASKSPFALHLISVRSKRNTYGIKEISLVILSVGMLRKSLGYKVPALAHSFVCLCTERTANRNFHKIIYSISTTPPQSWRTVSAETTETCHKELSERKRDTAAFHNAAIDMNCASTERKSKEHRKRFDCVHVILE